MVYNLYTFGNGEILKGLFDALAICLNADDGSLYTPLIRISLIIGGLWAALYALYGDFMRAITHWIVPMTIIMQLLFVPHATLWIHDPVSRYHQKVDKVPYGLAMMAGTVSKIGHHLTEQVEKVFRLPDDLTYQQSGMLFASNLIQQAKTFRITNEAFAENMRQFVGQCVAYDVLLGRKYTLHDLRHSTNIWALVSKEPSKARSFLWRDFNVKNEAPHRPRIITCAEGVELFNKVFPQEVDETAQVFGKKLLDKKANINLRTELLNHLKLAYSTLGEMATQAEELLKQNMMIYAVVEGLEQKSTSLGNAPNFALRRAYLQQRATYETLGALAAETLPSMKAVLEAISYGAFLFVMPLAILPFGFRFLSTWLQTLLWLQMWAPLYAILNYIMTMAAKSKSIAALSVSNANEAGITIANSVGLVNVNADIAAMAGYLALSIPFLCIAMVKGLGSVVQMASHLSQVSQSAGTQAAQDLVSGNYSFGNVGVGARQFANAAMLSQSYGASYRSGSFHQADGRTDIITSSDGEKILNIATSNIPIHLNVAESLSNQKLEQSSKSYQTALTKLESYAENLSDVLKQSADLSEHLGKGTQFNKTTGKGTTIDHTTGLSRMGQIVKDFSDSNQITEQRGAQILAGATVGAKHAGTGVEAGANLKGGANKQDIYSKAEKVVQSQDFQDALRQTEQAFQNESFGQLSDEGQRLVENIHQAWDKSMGFRREAAKHFKESDDYQNQASHIKNTASTVNANYNHAYVEWLSGQIADNTGGRPLGLDGAGHMIAKKPQMAVQYAQRFLAEQGLEPQRPQEIANDPKARATQQYDEESRHVFLDVNEENARQKMQALKIRAAYQGLAPVNDQGLQRDFKKQQERVQNKIAAQQQKIDQKYEEAAQKHEAQSRKSTLILAAKQELLHVWDVCTHSYDLVTGVYKSARDGVNNFRNRNKHDPLSGL